MRRLVAVLDAGNAPDLAKTIDALAHLRQQAAAGSQDDVDVLADTHMLRAAPAIIRNPNDAAVQSVIVYFQDQALAPPVRDVLRKIVDDRGPMAALALEKIVAVGDSRDLPWLTATLAGPAPAPVPALGDYTRDVHAVAANFGPHAIPLLRAVMTKSDSPIMRDTAAIELSQLGQSDAEKIVAKALASKDKAERQYVLGHIGRLNLDHFRSLLPSPPARLTILPPGAGAPPVNSFMPPQIRSLLTKELTGFAIIGGALVALGMFTLWLRDKFARSGRKSGW
jgi:hypothetical protein